MTERAAIILAGGKAKRFQSTADLWQDKALVELYGKPLLIHVIENVRDVVEEIVVCVNEENRRVRYAEVLKNHDISDVKLVVDEKDSCVGGPLIAIDMGLRNVNANYCLTLPGDMPLMKAKVLEYMFQKAPDANVVVPMWPNGQLETLSTILERKSASEIADTLCQLRRPRSDDIIRGALDVWFLSIINEISNLDPELKSFVNINSLQDLVILQPRIMEGPVKENLHIKTGTLRISELVRLREAATLFSTKNFLKASRIFSSCATNMESEDSFFWAAVSRENEGKSILSRFKGINNPESAIKILSEGKRALLKAAYNYGLEAEMHEKFQCFFLADRARSDQAWCELRANKY
jgi:molybdopterin-guanine dinucleotide biosynthesis protein A